MDLDALESLRLEPLPGEQQVHWAIQDGNNTETRVLLPSWVATPILTRLAKVLSEKMFGKQGGQSGQMEG